MRLCSSWLRTVRLFSWGLTKTGNVSLVNWGHRVPETNTKIRVLARQSCYLRMHWLRSKKTVIETMATEYLSLFSHVTRILCIALFDLRLSFLHKLSSTSAMELGSDVGPTGHGDAWLSKRSGFYQCT
jgi:hypothetical protein